MNLDHSKLALKRWLTTATFPSLPVPPQFTPALPNTVIGRNWPVFDRGYPRSVRWPLNGSRLLVWLTARALQPLLYVRFLRWFCWLGWNIGAAFQALLAVVVATVAFVFLAVPLKLLGGAVRGVAWVVLIRRGWQPPLPASFDSYLDALDRELDAAIAAQDQADALVATMQSLDGTGGPEVYQVAHVDYPLHTTDPALVSDTAAGRRGPRLWAILLVAAAVVVVALAIGITSVDLPRPPEWSEIHDANQGGTEDGPAATVVGEVGP